MKKYPIFLNYIEGLPPIPTKIKKVPEKESITYTSSSSPTNNASVD